MLRFLDSFYRARRRLLAMAAVTAILSIGFAVMQHRTYEVTARVWVDVSIQGDHPNPYITAADAGTQMLNELLRTRAFCTTVGRRSRLVTASGPGRAANDQTAGDVAYATLSSILLGTAGPNILTVTFRHNDPTMAAGVTKAVIDVFKEQVLSAQADRASASVAFYRQQVQGALDDLSRADGRISDYLGSSSDSSTAPLGSAAAADPNAAQPGVTTDSTLLALQRDEASMRKRADDLTQRLSQAQLSLTVVQQSNPYGFRVVDPPLAPAKPLSRTRTLIAAAVGGVGAGALLSLLVLMALTAADSSLRYPAEVEPALNLRLVGTLPEMA
jgi:uncharacterized protein involved in exopolysaccharide biosynthesis